MADSTTASTLTLSAAAKEAVDHFYTSIGEVVSGWEKIFTVKKDQREMTDYKPVMLDGIANYTAQNATGERPDAAPITFSGTAYSASAFEKRATITEYALARNPGIMMELSQAMVDSAATTISSLCFGLIAAADTENHPGGYTVASGTAKLCDTFTSPAQSNTGTAELSAASLQAAFEAMRGWKAPVSSAPLDFASGQLVLVIPPALEQTAINLKAQNVRTYDGGTGVSLTDVTSGLFGDYLINPHTTDATDWALINAAKNPFGLWLPREPFFRVQPEPGAGRLEIYSGYEAGVFLNGAHTGGCYFSKVTG